MYDKALEILNKNRKRLDLLSSYIFKEETIYGEEFKKNDGNGYRRIRNLCW